MPDSEWQLRLRKFANTGVWPSNEGNRPAPRQKKWYTVYQRIEKCPRMVHGQRSLFGALTQCVCGFHTDKPTTSSTVENTGAPVVQGVPLEPTTAVGPAVIAKLKEPSATEGPGVRSMLQKLLHPRFGGSHLSTLKPNLSMARRVTKAPAPSPSPLPALHLSTPAPSPSPAPSPLPALHLSTPAPAPVSCPATAVSHTVPSVESGTDFPETSAVQMPRLWAETLPPEDHSWIKRMLFRQGPKGKLVLQDNIKLWYYPPQTSHIYHQAPHPDRFFAHLLLVWMPYKLWKVRVVCPKAECGQHQLTGGGIHKRARRVLDVDRIYNVVTEILICTKCKGTHVSWSQTILKQLHLPHRMEFRVILTQKFACDIRVIRLLRERGLGNSPTRLLNQLRENHTEEWLTRVGRFTTACLDFLQRPGLKPLTFPEPPAPAVVPTCKWLLSVYSQDILTRVDDIKASITSTLGTILKMDSTKKITKKLAGTAKGTAYWMTSVGNEYGQVLISVLTAQEGAGLDLMVAGLVRRYQQAGAAHPVLLYVDCGCCADAGETKLKARFSGWPSITVRLDIWHFMRRLAMGCSTDAHPLCPAFMSGLSSCVFEWDAGDVALLREAKCHQLQSQGLSHLTDDDVSKHLSKDELLLHCRRRTRGVETTIQMLEELINMLMGSRGSDSLGVPLFDRERMEHIWHVQKKHVRCIQDIPGVALYTKTGELTKGGLRLPTYRCARGSTSLESFHLHLNRFIPGTSANSLNFQIYLLEGLHRWNQDRAAAALSTEPSPLRSYSNGLVHQVNNNHELLYGKKLVPLFCPPSVYTGELIGVQYLFNQTGQALQDMHPDSEQTAELIEGHDVGDDTTHDEGFFDDPTVGNTQGDQGLGSLLSPPSSHMAPTSSIVAPGSATVVPSTSTMATGPLSSISSLDVAVDLSSEDDDMALGDQNAPGFQHVDRLAEYLVELREQTSLYLTNHQAKMIVSFWHQLSDADKKRVVYAARHQSRLLSGRFRIHKKPRATPGVESTTRCMLGATSAPAQWPDCCRLIETIFIRLCTLYPCHSKKARGSLSRWSLILKDYRMIRQLVLENSYVMKETDIQLVEVNQTTLTQWHNERQKKQELSVLMQGVSFPTRIGVSEEPLQEAKQLPAAPTPARQEHHFTLPESTAGQAKRTAASLRQIAPRGTETKHLVTENSTPGWMMLTPGGLVQLVPVSAPPASTLQATNLAQRTAQQTVTASSTPTYTPAPAAKRTYRRSVAANTCKKCGNFRTAESGHSHFRGTVYCPQTESVPKAQWLEEMRKNFKK